MDALTFRPCMGQLATRRHQPVRPDLVRDILSSRHAMYPLTMLTCSCRLREIRRLANSMVACVSASDRGDNRCLQNVGRTGSPELRPCAQGRRLDCSPSPTLQKRDQGRPRLAHESSPPLDQLGYRYSRAAGHTHQLLHVPALHSSAHGLLCSEALPNKTGQDLWS
jgi:hypothetical protein